MLHLAVAQLLAYSVATSSRAAVRMSAWDFNNVLVLDHVNMNHEKGRHDLVKAFYFDVLGLTADPRKAENLELGRKGVWANAGITQFHLPEADAAQVLDGSITLVYSDLAAAKQRCAFAPEVLAGTNYSWVERSDWAQGSCELHVTCPWGTHFVLRQDVGAYDARGEDIIIHGQNFGGVESLARVFINGEQCDNAQWHRQHDVVGLPYVSCTARETVVGIANVSLFVAGQQSSFLITESLDAAGVRAVCKESTDKADLNLLTGKQLGYWGRNEPVGELCAPCQAGSLCQTGTYESPTSLSGYFMVELDVGNKMSGEASAEESAVTKRERRDYARAMETLNSIGRSP